MAGFGKPNRDGESLAFFGFGLKVAFAVLTDPGIRHGFAVVGGPCIRSHQKVSVRFGFAGRGIFVLGFNIPKFAWYQATIWLQGDADEFMAGCAAKNRREEGFGYFIFGYMTFIRVEGDGPLVQRVEGDINRASLSEELVQLEGQNDTVTSACFRGFGVC